MLLRRLDAMPFAAYAAFFSWSVIYIAFICNIMNIIREQHNVDEE